MSEQDPTAIDTPPITTDETPPPLPPEPAATEPPPEQAPSAGDPSAAIPAAVEHGATTAAVTSEAPGAIAFPLGGDEGYTPGAISGQLNPERAVKLTRLVNGFADAGRPCSHFEALARLLDAV